MVFYLKVKTIFKLTTNLLEAKYVYYRTGSYSKQGNIRSTILDYFLMKYSFKTVVKININSNMLFSSYKWDDVEKQSFSV